MSNESQVLRVVAGAPSKRVTGEVSLVTEAGAAFPASSIPALPTDDGDYQLTVASGVYSWTEIT
jgi:hypothetical protein